MFQHDSFFFIGVFIFIFLLWLVLGGPSRPLSFSGPLLTGPQELGGGTYLSLPRAPGGVGSLSGSSASGSGEDRLSFRDQQAVNDAIEAAAFGPSSMYRGDVTMSHSVRSAGSSNPQQEYLQLSVSSRADGPISISGWRVVSDVSGNGAVIPQGTEVPRSGTINASQPIVLQPGDRAIITSGRSPIGASFRENVCIAYFEQFQDFSPTLPNSCPRPEDELEDYYGPDLIRDPSCIDYVDRLDRCELAISPPTSLSSACQSFLTTYLNYNGCVIAHEQDSNFKGKTWRVYLGRDTSLWRSDREVVRLVDSDGKTVDMFTY